MTLFCTPLPQAAALALLLAGEAVAAPKPERIEGEVALSVPGCEVFVVKSPYGLSVVREQQYHAVFEGDRVRGLLAETGEHEIEIVGEMTVRVVVEGTDLTIETARKALNRACHKKR